jgi:hypothetical protein
VLDVDILFPEIWALHMSPQTQNCDSIKTTPNILISSQLFTDIPLNKTAFVVKVKGKKKGKIVPVLN